MKSILTKITSLFGRSFEGFLPASEIKAYVLRKYDRLKSEPQKGKGVDIELTELEKNLAALGWIGKNGSLQIEKNKNENEGRSSVDQWIKDLKNSKIIDGGIIAKGTGTALDWLDNQDEDQNGFNARALESILKFVEVKRKKIINAFSRELTRDEVILEGLSISILLSHTSRRHKDLRYLNAALKMNDWYFPICQKSRSEKTSAVYLLALTEQERSAEEMLK